MLSSNKGVPDVTASCLLLVGPDRTPIQMDNNVHEDPDLIDLDPDIFRKFFHEISRMKSMLQLQMLKIPGFELDSLHLESLSIPEDHEDLEFAHKKISVVIHKPF
jgi:hypothetical protein